MLASKRTRRSSGRWRPAPAALGALGRAGEAGHLAEHPVERHAGEGEAGHAERRGRRAGRRCASSAFIRVIAHLGDGDRVDEDDEGAEQQRHDHRAAALAAADLVLRRVGGHATEPAVGHQRAEEGEQIEDRESEQALLRPSSPPARSARLARTREASSEEDGAERGGGDAVERRRRGRAARARPPPRPSAGCRAGSAAGSPSRPPPPAASARRPWRNRSGRTATAPRNAAASTGR